MSYTPLTDALIGSLVNEDAPAGHQLRSLAEHAERMECDRARLLEALQFYAGATATALLEDAGSKARRTIIKHGDSF